MKRALATSSSIARRSASVAITKWRCTTRVVALEAMVCFCVQYVHLVAVHTKGIVHLEVEPWCGLI